MLHERPLIAMEAEHGVLGALMKRPDLCETVGAFLSPADFSDADNALLYTMILGCHSKKIVPDPLALAEVRVELPSGELTMVYATELWQNVASSANAETYGRIVVERSKARSLYAAGERLMELAQQRGKIPEQIAEAQGIVLDLNAQDERPDVVTLREAMIPVFDDMEIRLNGTKPIGLKFNLPDLDEVVQGLRPGNLVIIAGRPGTGKTVLGVGLADEIAVRNKGSALVFSLEMSQAELAKRSLAALSGVSQGMIDSGQALLCDDSITRMTAAVNHVANGDVRICDKGALTFSRICAIARFENRAKPLSLIVIDYLGLIAPEPNSRHQNRNQELGAISRGLKALAKELGVPVVALAQLNRSIETRADAKPKMSDLRDSGEIEQDADVIIMAHRDMNSPQGQNGITELDVVKCRHAKPGFCLLQFQGEFARFVSCAQQREEQQQQQAKPQRPSAKSMMANYQPRVVQ
ncbi:DnaB-like helicase C-terminal domain-containing protein [Pseudomonas sp.]|uniref:DnaB-like helicase C-terminal domain-containing protein n=1 Tax=Pseudomonas sp. TaxID=306 RepID=UPI00290CC649|nr:DnaB-like helicase C-terminal domain-containing protein [Pseudomonas sp.]MDU4249041.1 DnaB-like helicase C-terminal domain-containing protein [Pseudomonas sp.]